jgi:hypothetical protein
VLDVEILRIVEDCDVLRVGGRRGRVLVVGGVHGRITVQARRWLCWHCDFSHVDGLEEDVEKMVGG